MSMLNVYVYRVCTCIVWYTLCIIHVYIHCMSLIDYTTNKINVVIYYTVTISIISVCHFLHENHFLYMRMHVYSHIGTYIVLRHISHIEMHDCTNCLSLSLWFIIMPHNFHHWPVYPCKMNSTDHLLLPVSTALSSVDAMMAILMILATCVWFKGTFVMATLRAFNWWIWWSSWSRQQQVLYTQPCGEDFMCNRMHWCCATCSGMGFLRG